MAEIGFDKTLEMSLGWLSFDIEEGKDAGMDGTIVWWLIHQA